ncbi:MAG: hypothetical protein RLZZ350_1577 [Verrucomicrobiota bacterium]|jgi:hypothetical protein
MARKNFYLPKDDLGRVTWLNTFALTLPNYQVALGLTNAEVDSLKADAKCFDYLLKCQTSIASYANGWTSFKNDLRDGSDAHYDQYPAPPNLGVAPPLVAPGIFSRATLLVARIKTSPAYSEALGVGLGIIGTEHSDDLTTVQPELTVWQESGKVKVSWKKGRMSALEIWVDRGAGFVFQALNTIPDYTDPTPLPTGDQAAVWKYKGLYRKGDQPVGQWSNITSLAVAAV